MSDPNVFEPAWDAEYPAPPFCLRASRVAARAGARQLGATLYEIEPGGRISPVHIHYANEELLVVLAGRPQLLLPDNARTLEPGAVVAFRAGLEGAHAVANTDDATEPARVMIISTMRYPDVAEHVSTATTLVVTGPRAGRAFPAGTDVPLFEALTTAIAFDAEA